MSAKMRMSNYYLLVEWGPNAAPPKNKKNSLGACGYYKQATPTGFGVVFDAARPLQAECQPKCGSPITVYTSNGILTPHRRKTKRIVWGRAVTINRQPPTGFEVVFDGVIETRISSSCHLSERSPIISFPAARNVTSRLARD